MVTSQCDAAMQNWHAHWHLDWRNDCYVKNLDKVLEILKISDRGESIALPASQRSNTSDLARGFLNHPVLDSLPSLASTDDGTGSLEPSPNSVMSWMSTDNSHTAAASSQTTSPTNTSQASVSPTSPDLGNPTSPVISCLACSKKFKGSPQDAMSNYRRHLRTTRRHDRKAGLKCPMPECVTNIPMRSDNLKGHLRNKHKMDSEAEIQRNYDIARSSAMTVDSNGRRRHRSHQDSNTDSSAVTGE